MDNSPIEDKKYKKSKDSKSSRPSILMQIGQRGFLFYLLSAAVIVIVCLVFGLRSAADYANGFLYGSIAVVIFGALIVAGNSARNPIPELSYFIPTRRPHDNEIREHFRFRDEGLLFFAATLISGALLFITSVLIRKG